MITEVLTPGIYSGLDDETYHGDPIRGGSLSSSFARLLTLHVPAKARAIRANRKPTRSMNLGKAAHLHALGAGPEMVVWEYDGRTKAGKSERADRADDIAAERAVAVTAAERDQVLGMAKALRADPEVSAILDSAEPEVSIFWREKGTWCRGRFDLLGDVGDDYKTCDDASPRGFERAMSTYGYHQQADFYLRGLRALGHPAGDQPMRFICQEKEPPYLVQIHTCDDLAMEVAAALNDRAIDIYAYATATGEWDGYPELQRPPTGLPANYFYRHADIIPAHLNPYADPEMSM
ncbi:MAG TPA: PD-(D/E)XK nuclease-like domain-containing protein [Nocardioidaceae bacterium]|nr:PD-(D/E)XK nuclease-like domain-containing protein [Nocardioidaceae bacterium]